MKKKKKGTILLFVINIMAFVFVTATIRTEFGFSLFLKLIVPLIVMFSTNLSTTIIALHANSSRTGDGECENRTGDGSLS